MNRKRISQKLFEDCIPNKTNHTGSFQRVSYLLRFRGRPVSEVYQRNLIKSLRNMVDPSYLFRDVISSIRRRSVTKTVRSRIYRTQIRPRWLWVRTHSTDKICPCQIFNLLSNVAALNHGKIFLNHKRQLAWLLSIWIHVVLELVLALVLGWLGWTYGCTNWAELGPGDAAGTLT